MIFRNTKPHVLVSAGLLGIAGYEVILRLFHPRFMGNDFAHGIWFGVCLGLEILGLILLRKTKWADWPNPSFNPAPAASGQVRNRRLGCGRAG